MDLDAAGVRRARARAQLLNSTGRNAAAVVSRLVGIQAQQDRAAALAIRARTTGLTVSSVTDAVARGSLVLTWTLRGTRHLHHRKDLAWLLALFGPIYSRHTKRDVELGIAGAVGQRAIAALRDALASDGPLTRAAVKERLAPVGVGPDGQAAIHVIRKAALAGILSIVPGDGGKERYAPLAREPSTMPPDEAVAELARRYIRGYGPTTPADFAAWSGLGLRTAERAWPADHRTARTNLDPVPLRLLGGFDNFLLGYADRTPQVPAEHARKVNAGGGLVKPVVIDDGRVVGTWALPDRIEPFPGEQFDAAAVERELADVRQFLADRQ
ncbi:MAG: winged helix DNA-binding domain-containing protein [Acidimicrobiales bacterium]